MRPNSLQNVCLALIVYFVYKISFWDKLNIYTNQGKYLHLFESQDLLIWIMEYVKKIYVVNMTNLPGSKYLEAKVVVVVVVKVTMTSTY